MTLFIRLDLCFPPDSCTLTSDVDLTPVLSEEVLHCKLETGLLCTCEVKALLCFVFATRSHPYTSTDGSEPSETEETDLTDLKRKRT